MQQTRRNGVQLRVTLPLSSRRPTGHREPRATQPNRWLEAAQNLIPSAVMRQSWRVLAVVLFFGAVFVGGLLGDRLLALTDQTKAYQKLVIELVEAAHDKYGTEVRYRDIVYGSIHGMLRTLDPHTSFLSKEAYASMREKQQASFYGLGIYVGLRNGRLTVITPIPGTPAFRLGMRAGDVIAEIEGEPTDEMTVDEAIGQLKGPKDTTVNISIERAGLDEPLQMEVTRAEIPQTTVQYSYMLTPEVGYLNIRDFARSTGSEVARALAELKEQGMTQLLLDIRNNGGGLLDQAIEVADQFVPAGTKIVETKGRIPSSFSSYSATGNYEELDMPLVVLVNGGSASASEILSGAIQDHDVGLVVGQPTWGKGLVQTVYTLPHGSGLALTTARYYSPSGRLIQRDYSSYWDYYTDYDAEGGDDAGAGGEQEVFTTDLGRKVYGGGGVTPDHVVEPKSLPTVIQKIFSRSGFFTFGVDYNRRNPVTSQSWEPPQAMMDEFKAYIVEKEMVTQEEADEGFADPEVTDYIRHRFQFEIFNSAFGLDEGHRAFLQIDNQVQAALDHLAEAQGLLERRRALRPGSATDRPIAP